MDKYKLLETIGEGTYGIVFKCQHKRSGRIVAVKRFKEARGNEYIRCTMLRELRVQQLLKGEPYVVQLLEAFQEKGTLFLVMENASCNLLDVLDRQPTGLEVDSLRVLIFTLLLGLRSCHSNGIVHRDVKPENILIKDDGTATLCDFGFSRPITLTQSSRSASPALQRWSRPRRSGNDAAESESDDSDVPPSLSRSSTTAMPTLDELVLAQHRDCMTDYVATRWYRSPEMLLGMQQYDFAVDVWAVGAIMGEAADGQPLLPGNTEVEQLSLIQTRIGPFPKQYQSLVRKRCGGVLPVQLRTPQNKNPLQSAASRSKHYTSYLRDRFLERVGADGVDLLEKLLSPGAKRRISVEEALTHSFFASLAERRFQSAAGSPVSHEVSAFTVGLPSSDTLDEDDGRVVASTYSVANSGSSSSASTSTSSASSLTPVCVPSQLPPDESPNPRIEESEETAPARLGRCAKFAASVGTANTERAKKKSDDRLPARKTRSPIRPAPSADTQVVPLGEGGEPATTNATTPAGARDEATAASAIGVTRGRASSSSGCAGLPSGSHAAGRSSTRNMSDSARAEIISPHAQKPQQPVSGAPFSASATSKENESALTRSSNEASHGSHSKRLRTQDLSETDQLSCHTSASRVPQQDTEPVRSDAWVQRRALPQRGGVKRETSEKFEHRSARPPLTASVADRPRLVPRDGTSGHNMGSLSSSKRGPKHVSQGSQSNSVSLDTSQGKHSHVANGKHTTAAAAGVAQSSRTPHKAARPPRSSGASTGRYASPDLKRKVMKATRPSHEEKPRLLREIETLTCAVAPVESLEELLPIPSSSVCARRIGTHTSPSASPTAAATSQAAELTHTPNSLRPVSRGSEPVAQSPVFSTDTADGAPLRRRVVTRAEKEERSHLALPLAHGRQTTATSSGAARSSPADCALGDLGGAGSSSRMDGKAHGTHHNKQNSSSSTLRQSLDSLAAVSTHENSVINVSLPFVAPLSPSPSSQKRDATMASTSSGADALTLSQLGSTSDGKPRQMVFRARRHSPLGPPRSTTATGGIEVPRLAGSVLNASGLPDADVGTGGEGGPTRAYSPHQFGRRPQPKLRRPPPLAQAPSLSPAALASMMQVVDVEPDDDERSGLHPLASSHNSTPSHNADAPSHRSRADTGDDVLLVARSKTTTPLAESSPFHNGENGGDPFSRTRDASSLTHLHTMRPPAVARNSDAFYRASPLPSYGSSNCISPVAGVTMDSVVRFQQQQLSGNRRKTRLTLKTPTEVVSKTNVTPQ